MFGDPLLDDLIRPEQKGLRDRQAECLGGLEVDYKVELRRLLDRKLTSLGAFQNFVDICSRPAEEIGEVRPICDEAASLDELPRSRHRREMVLLREVDDLPRMVLEGEINNETAHGFLLQIRENLVQFGSVTHQQRSDPDSQRSAR